jgi:hypothetical protein
VDVLLLAPRLAAESGNDAVMSRKGHIAWYAERNYANFPRVETLPELAEVARAEGAGHLYYSWCDARLRPEFLCLLDPSAEVPGLERIASSDAPPAMLFRIGPEFGRAPAWWADPYQRRVHEAHAAIRFQSASESAPARAVLAADALVRGDIDLALRLAHEARVTQSSLALAWRVEESALRASGREAEARATRRSAPGSAGGAIPNWPDLAQGPAPVEERPGEAPPASNVHNSRSVDVRPGLSP